MLLALTRDLTPAIRGCELTHLARSPIDLARARAEHGEYEACLEKAGCTVRRLPADPDHADAVFIEDTAVVLAELAVIARPGAESRRAETPGVATALAEYRPLRHIEPPGTLDGGDVLRVGRRVFVGRSGRTNDAGIDQLRRLLAPHGYDVVAVPVRGCLHLKTAVTAAADDLLLVNRSFLPPDTFAGLELADVDPAEPFAANALRVGATVIYPAEFPRTRERLERRLGPRGITVRPVPAGELAKAEGGVTCCSIVVEVPGARGEVRGGDA